MPKKYADKSWIPKFVEAFRNSGNVRAACQAAGIRRQLAYEERARNPQFAEEWDQAREDAIDTLEATAWKRARETSDYLLWKLLQSNRRSLYGDKQQHEVTGPNGGPVEVQILERIIADPDAAKAAREAFRAVRNPRQDIA